MWLIYSVACALSDSIASLTNKKLISKKQDPMSVSLFIHGFGTLAFLALAVITSQKLFPIGSKLLLFIIITAAATAAAGVILLMSFRKGDLSLIAPIQTITPLLILLIAIFFLKESPSPIGLIGIILILVGGVVLDKDPGESIGSIAKRIVSYKPALLGVLAAGLYAIASVFDKGGLKITTLGVWIFYVYFFIFIFIMPIVLFKRRKELTKLKENKLLLLASAFFSVSAIYLQLLALQTALVTYVLSVKRLSSVFAVVLSYIFLDETKALHRLRGAAIMVAGAILIGLS
ncbi:MAG: EamA family transporter [bacterium]